MVLILLAAALEVVFGEVKVLFLLIFLQFMFLYKQLLSEVDVPVFSGPYFEVLILFVCSLVLQELGKLEQRNLISMFVY